MRAAILILAAALVGGCGNWDNSWWQKSPPAPPPPPPPAAASQPAAAGPAAAYVNGVAISMDDLNDLLIRSEGMDKAWLLVTAEIVRQEAAKRRLQVTDADLRAEEDESLQQAFAFLEPGQRPAMLERELKRRNISRMEWQIILRRNASLRKLAAADVKVTDAEMQEVFRDLYGPKVVVRHIQTDSPAKAQEVLQKFQAGNNFAELARKYSMNSTAQDGGLLPPITENSVAVPPLLRQTALALEREGQVSSPIQVGTTYHILYLEKKSPAQNVTLAEVRPAVEAAARKKKTLLIRDSLLKDLVHRAKIVYAHPVLKEEGAKEQK